MKVSTKGRYGLRVMMELAGHYGLGPMPVDVIAKRQELSGKYIHLIVMALRSARLVRSVRGPNGGYELAKDPATISAFEVVSALEGGCVPVDCVADINSCTRISRCAAHNVWCEVASAIEGILSSITLEQLADRQRTKDEEPPNYYI